MLLSYLRSKYSHDIDEGWGAFEIGNHEKAEKHFRYVLSNEDDPRITVFDAVEAHNGLGAVSRAHKDFLMHGGGIRRQSIYWISIMIVHGPELFHGAIPTIARHCGCLLDWDIPRMPAVIQKLLRSIMQ